MTPPAPTSLPAGKHPTIEATDPAPGQLPPAKATPSHREDERIRRRVMA